MSYTGEVEEKQEAETPPSTVEDHPKEAEAEAEPEKKSEASKKKKKKKDKAKEKNKKMNKNKKKVVEENEKPYLYVHKKKEEEDNNNNNNKNNKKKNRNGNRGKNKWEDQKHSPYHQRAAATMLDVYGFRPLAGPVSDEEAVAADLFGSGPVAWAGEGEPRNSKEKYMKQIHETQGFDIDYFPRGYKSAPIVPYHHVDDEDDEWLNEQCRKALAKYNSLNGSHYEFMKVEKANLGHCAGFDCFLTFQARKRGSDALVMFQARVYDAAIPQRSHVKLCRLRRNVQHTPSSSGAAGGVEDTEDDEPPLNTFFEVLYHMNDNGNIVEALGNQRVRMQGFQYWSADEVDQVLVLRQIMRQGVGGVLDFYPSLYREFKGNAVYCGPTEEEIRRRDKKLERDENYVLPEHNVTIYGFGIDEETGEEYYDAKNCWGIEWADKGWARIKRSLFTAFAFPNLHGMRIG